MTDDKDLRDVADVLASDPDFFQIIVPLQNGWREYDRGISDEVMARYVGGQVKSFHRNPPPHFITEFIARYLERTESPARTLLEIPSGPLGLLPPLVDRLGASQGYGVCCSVVEHRVARVRYADDPLHWYFFNGKHVEDAPYFASDVFISTSFDTDDDALSELLLEWTYTSEAETLFFFVPDERGPALAELFWRVLQDVGVEIEVEAVLTIPSVTFARFVDVPVSLLVLHPEREQHEVFVGALNDNGSAIDSLLDNLLEHRTGSSPALGTLFTPEALRTVRQLAADEQFERRFTALGHPSCRLEDIGFVVDAPGSEAGARLRDYENSVYIPVSLGANVATQPTPSESNATVRQVILDPSQALAEYAAAFFNSDLGRESLDRRRYYVALAGNNVAYQDLGKAMIALPDIQTQRRLIAAQTTIRDAQTELRTLERQLWSQPGSGEEVRRKLLRFERGESLEDWMETLPFPLASVVWQYLRESVAEKKVDHLLHFFEAAAQFQAALLLSGSRQMPWFEKGMGEASDADPSRPPFGDFGTWIAVSQNLGRGIIQALNTAEGQSLVLPAFGSLPPEFLKILAGEALLSVIRKAGRWRNEWKGHGGIYGETEARTRLGIMEDLLSRFHSVVLDRFSEVPLLLPTRSAWDGTGYDHEVQVLVGSRTPFRHEAIRTSGPLSTKSLYVGFNLAPQPLELVPLLVLGPEPPAEKEAVYFYNRVVKGRVRWVSYHYRRKGEMETRLGEVPGLMPTLELVSKLKVAERP